MRRRNRKMSQKMSVTIGRTVQIGAVMVMAFAVVLLNMLANSSCKHLEKRLEEKKLVIKALEDEKERVLLARDCVNDQLTVRALEKKVARLHAPVETKEKGVPDLPEHYVRNLVDKMKKHLGCAVRVTPGVSHANGRHTKGVVEIDFFDNDELDRIIRMIGVTID